MDALNFFNVLIKKKNNTRPQGIFSVCSANLDVLKVLFRYAREKEIPLLIESTSNQVNQFGGYTGMTPNNFKNTLLRISREIGYPINNLYIGGDHLGPFPFKNYQIHSALEKSKGLIEACVIAGYSKIHIDTSMAIRGDETDEGGNISEDIIANRAAILCSVAEKTCEKYDLKRPVYVIGTEVPRPGGHNGEINKDGFSVKPTEPEDLVKTVEITKKAFYKHGLVDAWNRVVAVVVQPGVEFGDNNIVDYDREKAVNLIGILKKLSGIVGEAHSTDYQRKENLKRLVEDGFAILKVGPALTFAYREAIFLLALIENEMIKEYKRSNLIKVLENTMKSNPEWWKGYYREDDPMLGLRLKYGLLDRVRYYWSFKDVKEALGVLFNNLASVEIPLSLISQYFPSQYKKIREGRLSTGIDNLIRGKIEDVLEAYTYATGLS